MRLLNLIIKEIKQQLRDRNGLIFSITFPIILTLVLGFALSGMFSSESGPSKINALYQIEDQSPLSQAFAADFIPEAKTYNLVLTEAKNTDNALDAVKKGEYSCFIAVSGKGIDITMREGLSSSAQIAETMIKGFVKGYDAYATVAKINPQALSAMNPVDQEKTYEYLKTRSLQKNKAPRALDYYALTMITLIIMYAAPGGSAVISEERHLKTMNRMFISPVTNAEILISKVTGITLVTCIQVFFVFLFDKLVLKTEWGNNLPAVAALLFAQILMVVFVGVGMAYLFKENTSGNTILNTLIPFLIFLGGGYVNLEMMGIGGWIEKLAWISPVKWLNRTLLQIIYANDYSSFGITIVLCLSIGAVFLVISAILSKKEAAA